jgi:hypothetical protein
LRRHKEPRRREKRSRLKKQRVLQNTEHLVDVPTIVRDFCVIMFSSLTSDTPIRGSSVRNWKHIARNAHPWQLDTTHVRDINKNYKDFHRKYLYEKGK